MKIASNMQARTTHSSFPAWLVAIIVGNLMLGLGCAIYLLQTYRDTDRVAELRTKNYIRLITANIDQLFSNIDVALRALSAEPSTGSASETRRLQVIETVAQNHPEFRSLTLHDRNGNFIGGRLAPDGKPFSIAGRPYLELLRDSPQTETIVSGPYQGRSNNRWSIVFARRINSPDGSFAGVVLTGYAVERFAETFKELELNESDRIIIRSADKALIASFPSATKLATNSTELSPAFAEALTQSPEQGFVARSGKETLDGTERMFAYRSRAFTGLEHREKTPRRIDRGKHPRRRHVLSDGTAGLRSRSRLILQFSRSASPACQAASLRAKLQVAFAGLVEGRISVSKPSACNCGAKRPAV